MDVNLIDLHIDGHHRSYLEMLAARWAAFRPEGVLRIFVSQEFVDTHVDLSLTCHDRVELEVIDVGAIPRGRLGQLTFFAWDARASRALRTVASHNEGPVVLMYFDDGQLAMAGFRGDGASVSGLYFRSPFHERASGRLSRWKGFRKEAVLRMALRNRGLHRVFCLDPRDVDPVNRLARRQVAVEIPDGVQLAQPSRGREEQRALLGAGEASCVMLMFGAISPRKGIVELSSAIASMDDALRSRTVLVVAGTTRPEDQELVSSALR